MPNRVQNVIEPHGDPDRVRRMLAEIQNDQYGPGTIDFNKLIPMPESLNIESGSRTRTGLEQYRAFLEVYTLCGTINRAHLPEAPPEAEEAFLARRPDIDRATFLLGKQAYRNEMQYGAPTWYEWCNQNWDTKWNAYGYEDGATADPGCIRFLTAWSAPLPVLMSLRVLTDLLIPPKNYLTGLLIFYILPPMSFVRIVALTAGKETVLVTPVGVGVGCLRFRFSIMFYGLITSHHVIEDNEFYDVCTCEHYPTAFKIVGTTLNLICCSKDNDYALFSIDDTDQFFLIGNSDSLVLGDPVKLIGYPAHFEGDSWEYLKTDFTKKTKLFGHPLYEVTHPVRHGASGGVVLDREDRIVGLICAGVESIDDLAFDSKQGFIPINTILQDITLQSC